MSSAAAQGFTRFEERLPQRVRGSGEPEVWIDAKGRVRLNGTAARFLNPKERGKAFKVDLYWNGEKRIIGIAPAADGMHRVTSTHFGCPALKALMSRLGGGRLGEAGALEVHRHGRGAADQAGVPVAGRAGEVKGLGSRVWGVGGVRT